MSCTTKRKSVGHLLLSIGCAILGALLVHSPLQAQTVSLLPMAGTQAADVTVEISQMVRLTNHARAQRGLYPYLLNPVLSQVAQSHVNDMIASGRLGHVGSDGSRAPARVRRAGFVASIVSENWVYSRTMQKAFSWWMADRPHFENLMSPRFKEIGVGMASHPSGWGQVWVMVFATSADGSTAPEAAMLTDGAEAALAADAATTETPDASATYVVQPGDTLEAIGRRLGIAWTLIAQLNDIKDPTRLQVGQVLDIPGAVPTPAAEPSPSAPPNEAPAPDQPPAEPPAAEQPALAPPAPAPAASAPTTYVVQAGDALASIAARFGLNWQTLAQWNGLSGKSILQVGQVLRLTSPTQPAVASNAPAPAVYRVRSGDSLSAIATRFGLTWQTLARINGLDRTSVLQVGQTLRLR
jgi:LysM repeat protein/uncharacterized protein YkwD